MALSYAVRKRAMQGEPITGELVQLHRRNGSPLLWDVFAVSTYFTVSLMFWYVGLIRSNRSSVDGMKKRTRHTRIGFESSRTGRLKRSRSA